MSANVSANNVEKNENRGMQGLLPEDSSELPTEDTKTHLLTTTTEMKVMWMEVGVFGSSAASKIYVTSNV